MRAAIAFSALFTMMTSSARRNARVASSLGGKEFQEPKHPPLTDKPSPRCQTRRWSASGLIRSAIALLLVLLLSTAAQAAKRVALVIGNSAYKHTGELANPRNDATDVAGALKAHGFQVITGLDLDKAALDNKIRDFAVALQGADVGLFFYAGHGLQVSGQNYLVPIDAQLTTASALDFEMVSLTRVHRIMESEAQTNILIIDACRDNPLARNLARAMGTRSLEIGRGLAAVELGVGTLISFSTQPGNAALDGSGRNSPFAGALTRHMSSSSSDDLSTLLIKVRNDVIAETKRRQVPWEHSALTGQFYFKPQPELKPAAPAAPVAPVLPSSGEAERAWILIKDTNSAAVLEAFIARYRDTFYAELARERVKELKDREKTAALQAKRGADEAEQRQLDALKSEEERRARAEAEAKRTAEEAERRRVAVLKAEEERRARAAAEAEARRKTEEVEVAARRVEEERTRIRFSDAMNKGNASSKSDNWDKAVVDYSEAIRIDSKPIAFRQRGIAYRRKGDHSRAMADFNEAIRLDPNFAAAFYSRGIAYEIQRDYSRAIVDFDEAIRLDPKPTVYYSRAKVYLSKGDHDKAIADLSEVIRLRSQTLGLPLPTGHGVWN